MEDRGGEATWAWRGLLVCSCGTYSDMSLEVTGVRLLDSVDRLEERERGLPYITACAQKMAYTEKHRNILGMQKMIHTSHPFFFEDAPKYTNFSKKYHFWLKPKVYFCKYFLGRKRKCVLKGSVSRDF